MRFQFAQWMTKPNSFNTQVNKGIPVPMRVMFGQIKRETEKSYIVDVYGKPEPTSHCLHCMRKLTHKVSMFYGLGPICGKHYYISDITEENLEAHFDSIRAKMAQIRWSGVVPKRAVKVEYEEVHTIAFEFQGKNYRVVTSDITKVKEIYRKSDKVVSDIIAKG